MAVNNSKDTEIIEDDFMPEIYNYDLDAQKYDYAEGKRQAEAYFFRNAAFPAVAVRVALVVSGTDDYTGRFDYYVKHIAEHKSIGVLESEHPDFLCDGMGCGGISSFYRNKIRFCRADQRVKRK